MDSIKVLSIKFKYIFLISLLVQIGIISIMFFVNGQLAISVLLVFSFLVIIMTNIILVLFHTLCILGINGLAAFYSGEKNFQIRNELVITNFRYINTAFIVTEIAKLIFYIIAAYLLINKIISFTPSTVFAKMLYWQNYLYYAVISLIIAFLYVKKLKFTIPEIFVSILIPLSIIYLIFYLLN